MADFDPSGVQVAQPINPVEVSAPRVNPAGQLADALQGISPEIHDFTNELGGQLQARAQAKAQADAFAQSGKPLADAVRDGTIEPTQNPWFIKAYNLDSAALRGHAAVSTLVDQSQSWAERSDPAAFQARFQKELGAIGQQFQTGHPETLQGFETAAAPLYKQAVSANEDFNVQRIQAEQQQNFASLGALAVQNTLRANPKADAAAVFAAMEGVHQQFIATGGSEPAWRDTAYHALSNAGANMQDPTVLDFARQSVNGQVPLTDYTAKDGQGYGDKLLHDQFEIARSVNYLTNARVKKETAATTAEGEAFVTAARAKFGYGLTNGTVSSAEVQQFAEASGVSYAGFTVASKLLAEDVHAVTGLTKDLAEVQAMKPGNIQAVMDLAHDVGSNGWTPANEATAKRFAASGILSESAGVNLIERADQRSDRIMQEGKADAREARSEGAQAASQARQFLHDAISLGRQQREDNNAYAVDKLAGMGDTGIIRNPQVRSQAVSVGNAAHDGYLAVHSGDYSGADKAQKSALATWGSQRAQRLGLGSKPLLSSVGAAPSAGHSGLK